MTAAKARADELSTGSGSPMYKRLRSVELT